MATDLTDWSPEILPDIPSAPVPAIKIAIRRAAIDFCRKTLLWTYDLERIDVVATEQSYALTVPADQYGRIISVDSVKYKQDGKDDDQFAFIDPISENQKDLEDPSGAWRYTTGPMPSEFWVDIVDKNLHLLPIPTEDSDEGLLIKVNLKPTNTCDTVPDFLYDDYVQEIGYGALADLFGRKAMDWYDPNQAKDYFLKFITACNNTKTKKITGATKRPLRVKMREWV